MENINPPVSSSNPTGSFSPITPGGFYPVYDSPQVTRAILLDVLPSPFSDVSELITTSTINNEVRVIFAPQVIMNSSGVSQSFSPFSTTVISFGTASPRDVAAGDVNADMKIDLLTINSNGTLAIIQNIDDIGNFGSPSYIQGVTGMSLETADLNGDTNIDIVTDDGYVLIGDGAGNFSFGTSFPVGAGSFEIRTGDLDLDGDIDIVVSNSNDDTLSVLLNNGSAVFSSFAILETSNEPMGIRLADLDADGDLDILVANEFGVGSNGNINIFENLGNTPPLGDLNGDGCVDGSDLAFLLSTWGECPRPPATCLADIDGNGIVNGADLATLLSTWTPDCAGGPAPNPGEFASAPTLTENGGTNSSLEVEEEITQSSNAYQVPWMLTYFGFTSVQSYVDWVCGQSDEELISHIQEMIQLILGE